MRPLPRRLSLVAHAEKPGPSLFRGAHRERHQKSEIFPPSLQKFPAFAAALPNQARGRGRGAGHLQEYERLLLYLPEMRHVRILIELRVP